MNIWTSSNIKINPDRVNSRQVVSIKPDYNRLLIKFYMVNSIIIWKYTTQTEIDRVLKKITSTIL